MSEGPPEVHYTVSQEVLARSRELLAEIGRDGFEAVVVWVGRRVDDGNAEVLAVWRPEQVCVRSADGVGVEVPAEAIADLIAALEPGTSILARVHTHPTDAYHSEVDNDNMLLSHQGAISVVVPDFAEAPIALAHCSVNELHHGIGWIELEPGAVERRFHIS